MKHIWRLLVILAALTAAPGLQAQQDTTAATTGGQLVIPASVPSVRDMYEYDPQANVYIRKTVVGDYDVSYPRVLTPAQYLEWLKREQILQNFKETNDAISGKAKAKDAQKDLLPQFYVNSKFFETIFGGKEIKFEPKGNFELDLGVRYTKRNNPLVPVRNRSNFGLDLNQRISMGITGHVGKRLNLNLNYDTQSMFSFNNQMKLDFNPDEDAILQKVEVGNVSMQTANSLVTGAQSLMGVRTVMRFGHTEITLVGAEQKSNMQTITARGGEVLEDYEVQSLHYDENRHFFLSQYFRQHYDEALRQYPYVNAPVRITKIEVWITNRNSNPQNVRNIVAIQDLGESEILGLDHPPAGFITQPGALPDNNVNLFNPEAIGSGQSLLLPAIRQIPTVSQGFAVPVTNGKDYVALENAVKLDSTQFTLHPKLGYITLKRKLNADEVLAVAFEYTVGNEIHKVGEFTDDGIVYPQTLVVKLLKSNISDISQPDWQLMMKNIYALNTYSISPDGFMMHILYADPTPLNYISPVNGTPLPNDVKERILLNVFHMDELNTSMEPQPGGDGFFDFIPGITVDPQEALIIFTSSEPFGKYLFEKLRLSPTENYDDPATWNDNQKKYVFRELYTNSQSRAAQFPEKNKFMLKGKYKSAQGGGIAVGGFNLPRGSVHVTAGGRELVEGVDYVVNYQAGRVEIINPALKASNVPIQVRVEQNNLFQQTTKVFTGIDVQHKFNDNFQIGATYLHLKEKPITWKSDYGNEPLNNRLFGLNGMYSGKVNILSKLVNYLPNIKTDQESRFSIRADFAYLKPGLAPVSNMNGESATLVEDFESSQSHVDLMIPYAWKLASVPARFPESQLTDNLEYGKNRAKLAWYVIDNLFYTNPPQGIDNTELSKDENRVVYIRELFDRDVQAGYNNNIPTLNLAYFPDERGPYNFDTHLTPQGKLTNPAQRWAGMMRPLTVTDFEQSNVQYITFWIMDPYFNNPNLTSGGKIYLDLGYIKEDILYDGRKQYENGLPEDGGTQNTVFTHWGKLPLNQSLNYAFDDDPNHRANQDVGLDGLKDADERDFFASYLNAIPAAARSRFQDDPSGDDYKNFLDVNGGIVERYKDYNNTEGNTPVNNTTGQTNANDVYPDAEDIDRDQTMNTIDAYFEYEVPFHPGMSMNDPYVADIKETTFTDASGRTRQSRWIQFKIPVEQFTSRTGNIADFRSIKFMRLYLTEFAQPLVLRFAMLDLIRSDWRNYLLTLDPADPNPADDPTTVEVTSVSSEENQTRGGIPYVSPPGVEREEIYQNNQVIRQNEQALSMRVCDLEVKDARGVFKYNRVDMRQFKNLKMFVHAESVPGQMPLQDDEVMAFLRFGTDLNQNFYEVMIPLKVTRPGTSDPEEVWPLENRMDLRLELLQKIKLELIRNGQANPQQELFFREDQIDPSAAGKPNLLTLGIKGNPDFADVRVMMVGIRNNSSNNVCAEVWFNELRLTGMKNKGGWATQGTADLTLADVATFNFSGGISTAGFGPLEQGPMGRSVENKYNYTFNTAVNMGKFLPEKWNITIPLSYSLTKQFIRPEYDPVNKDILLDDRLDVAANQRERDSILEVAQDRQVYKSIALTGVKKNYSQKNNTAPAPGGQGTGKANKHHFYDIENFTFNFTYSENEHSNYEVEFDRRQMTSFGILYNYNFQSKAFQPFAKTKSKWLRKKSMAFIRDFNFNPWISSITFRTDINRQFNNFRVRQLEDYGLDFPPMQSRDYKFNTGYTINWQPFKSMQITFNSNSYRKVDRFVRPDGLPDYEAGLWDRFFDIGSPYTLQESINGSYRLPLSKFPLINFLEANYTYNGSFQWQRSPAVMQSVNGYDLGNTIQNANTHQINGNINLDKLYRSWGITKWQKKWSGKSLRKSKRRKPVKAKSKDEKSKKDKAKGKDKKKKKRNTRKVFEPNAFTKAVAGIARIFTSVKRIRVNYQRTAGTMIPGYLQGVGIFGTEKPSIPYVLGWDRDGLRYEMARRGWLTEFPDLNQPYQHQITQHLSASTNFELFKGFKVDVKADRVYAKNYSETFRVQNRQYQTLVPQLEGNFTISYFLVPTAFEEATVDNDPAIERMRNNSYVIARRLAAERGVNVPATGYPDGYGPFQTEVLLYSFLSAYTKADPGKMRLTAFPTVPIPNWKVRYNGLMRLKWFKKHFRRFSLQHAYQSSLTVNRFANNMEFFQDPSARDVSDNFYSPISYGDVVLTEAFNPLVKVQMELRNSLQLDLGYKRDRMMSLNTTNYTLTRVSGQEVTVGLGYRIKDVYLPMTIGGNRMDFRSDLVLKADFSFRHNLNTIYGLSQNNTQPVSGQTLYNFRMTGEYTLTNNLSAILFYEHQFSKFAVSNAYPMTNIRGGITIKYSFK
ncbi:MAG: cell surface protein SprA [Chlorobi bacterium]|nr:cell surface protein SprA [Chlorobiota bacterium]